jgi:tetratricopeptide (TPR) repeat protein
MPQNSFMRRSARERLLRGVLLGLGAAAWGAGALLPRPAAQELVTEPLTAKEERVATRQQATPPAVTPTPDYFGHALEQRKYGEKKIPAGGRGALSEEQEIVTEPLLDAEPERTSRPASAPTEAEAPEIKKVFSYVPKPGAPPVGRFSPDTEGPVPVKGEDLKTEPLYEGGGGGPAAGDRALQIKADLDRNRVHLDESFTLTIDVMGIDLAGVDVEAPRVETLDLINANQAETRISQQGRMLKLRTYHFVYLPLATGTVTLPAVTLATRGGKVATEPLSLEVEGPRSGFAFQRKFAGNRSLVPKMMAAAPDAAGAKSGNEAEFYAQVSRPTVYVNQQVNLTVRFRCQTELGTKMGYLPPPLVGFISEELPQSQGEALVSGTRLRTLERVYRTALFPIHAGSLSVGAATAVISQGAKNKTQFADPLTVEVKPLPPDPETPGENSNALVGKYSLEAKADTLRTQAEAPIRIQFIVRGQGNLRGAPEPQLPGRGAWLWQLEEQHFTTRIENDVVTGESVFHYLAVPQKPGKASPGEVRLRYFNPEKGRWETAAAVLPVIWVAPKEKQIAVAAPVAGPLAAPVQARRELLLRPNHGGGRTLLSKRRLRVEENGYWAAQGVFLLMFFGGWLWTHRRRRSEEDALAVRARRAKGEVKKALKRAQALMARHEVQPFYDSISRATADYLAAKFGVPSTAIVLERLPEFFERFSVSEHFQSQFKISLTVCEYVRFAAMEFPVQDMRALLDDLDRTVGEFEKFWKQQQVHRKKTSGAVAAAVLLLLALGAWRAQAGEAELYFLRGNTFAQEGKPEAALAEYQKVISLGADDPDVYYNLGNMYLRLGQIGRAELAYERGLQLSPRDPDLLANLRQAAGCVNGEASVDDGWTGASFAWRAYQSFTVNELSTAASAAYVLAMLLLTAAWFWPAGAPGLRRTGLILLGAALLTGLWGGMRYTEPQWRKRALVLSGAAEVRSRPYADAEVLFVIPEGTRVKLEREEDEWVEVQLSHNRHGWVAQSGMAKID